MAEFLTRHNLSTYADAFDAHGWDDISQLSSAPESDLAKLVADVKMKSGHVARLRAALGKPAPTPPAPPAAPTQSQPHSSPHLPPPQQLTPPTQPPPQQQQQQTLPSASDAILQAKLYGRLMEVGALGEFTHGNCNETYMNPSTKVPVITMAPGFRFFWRRLCVPLCEALARVKCKPPAPRAFP